MTTTTCPAARPTTTAATATGEGASADGLPYHRLPHLDARSARWWRPFSTLAVGVGLLLAVAVLGLLVLLVAALTTQQGSFPAALTPSPGLDDPRNPMDLVVDLGSLGLLLPVVVLAARWGGRRRGTVHSVAGRFRWGTALRAGAVVLPLHAVVLWTLTAIAPPADLSLPPVGASLVAVVVVVLLLTPLQCAAEEYVFRGLPAQLLGTWWRSPVVGVVLPVPLFVLGHGYDRVGQVDVAVFALAMGFLVWKSGGLELAVVAHVANNLPLFLVAPLSPSSLQQGAVDPRSLLVSVPLTLVTTAGLSVWTSRVHGVRLLEPVRGRGRTTSGARP
ncbi:lysostaphin resistance A-like protein [Angustibacter aerolatus]